MFYATANQENICNRGNKIRASSGYLSSSQRQYNGAGTSYCPWVISATDGQRFNISIYKFVPYKESPLSSSSSVCFEIGTITEDGLSQGMLSCGSDPRTKIIYLSKGSDVHISFKDNSFLRDIGNFLLHYEGRYHNLLYKYYYICTFSKAYEECS